VLKRPASGLGSTAWLKKRVKISSWGSPKGKGVHLQWGPCVRGPLDINYIKEKKANSNRVKMYYTESF
jgi:hypothetical protein